MLHIRPAAPPDLDPINQIYNHYVLHSTATFQEEPATPEERDTWFSSRTDRFPVLVAQRGDDILGWASLNPFHARGAFRFTAESSIYVRHDRHRQGIGRLLMTHLLDRAHALDFHAILALIAADQTPSLALHQALHFQTAGLCRNVGYKFHRWIDLQILQYTP